MSVKEGWRTKPHLRATRWELRLSARVVIGQGCVAGGE